MDLVNREKKGSLEFDWIAGPTTINYLNPGKSPKLLTHLRYRRHGPYRFHGKRFGHLRTKGEGFCMKLYSDLKEFEKIVVNQASGSVGDDIVFHYGGDDF